jgi:hypothetical protein
MAPNEIWSAKVADLVRRAAEFGMVKCPRCLQGPVFATLLGFPYDDFSLYPCDSPAPTL